MVECVVDVQMCYHHLMRESPVILTVGLEPAVEKIIADILLNTRVVAIPVDIQKIHEPLETQPCIVISGTPKTGVAPQELAQILRLQYHHVPIFLCCLSKAGFERKEFTQNGFTDAFLVPIDNVPLRSAISEVLAQVSNGSIRVHRPVKIIDVEPGSTLDFDVNVFLSANKRYVKICHSGDSLDSEHIRNLTDHKMNNVFVPAEQMKHFYGYSAKRLKSIESQTKMSETERKEKMAGVIRELISGLFSEAALGFEAGQSILKDCGEIVKAYILDGSSSQDWYSRIQQVIGESAGSYSHAGNVSTLAALFSMGLGIGKPADLALAGLLHDIGIAELPSDIQMMEYTNMSADQKTAYRKHPDHTLNLIHNRKILVPEIVEKAILQHHENFDGSGFPKGRAGDRICKEAQVLALADRFDELTVLKDGVPRMTPAEAILQLKYQDPSRIQFDPELLAKLLTLFPA